MSTDPWDAEITYLCPRCYTSHALGVACPWNKDAVLGDGPAAPMTVNDGGGRQSALEVSFMLIDPFALWRLAEILYHGADSHGVDNWRKIPIEDHLDHAIAHIVQWCAGDRQDDHLGHAFCRMMMAVALELERERNSKDNGRD